LTSFIARLHSSQAKQKFNNNPCACARNNNTNRKTVTIVSTGDGWQQRWLTSPGRRSSAMAGPRRDAVAAPEIGEICGLDIASLPALL